jgi:UDP-glucose 4-epimerase
MNTKTSATLDGSDVLVTGGAGFIGSATVRTLLDEGARVKVVDNCFAGESSLVPEGASFERIDIRSDEMKRVVTEFDPDSIVHLAAVHYIPYCNQHPEETFEVNVMGTRALLEAARELETLDTVVFASSGAVYPPEDGPLDEESRVGPMDIYGRTKLVGEDLAALFGTESGVSTAAVRLFNVYGPNETNEHLIPAIFDQLRTGARTIELGNLSPKRDFVHVSDVARALTTLLTDFDRDFRTYNVGSGTARSVREVVECTSDALGEDIEIEQDDERVRESDRPHLQADIGRINGELGWEPRVEFVEGLRRLWSREHATDE